MGSGFDTVLLLLRGLTGSYSHRRPRSRQRSHCGRSSLHFFFFSLLSRYQHGTGCRLGQTQHTSERSLSGEFTSTR